MFKNNLAFLKFCAKQLSSGLERCSVDLFSASISTWVQIFSNHMKAAMVAYICNPRTREQCVETGRFQELTGLAVLLKQWTPGSQRDYISKHRRIIDGRLTDTNLWTLDAQTWASILYKHRYILAYSTHKFNPDYTHINSMKCSE